jgi:Autotransporter beta-domain
VFGPSLLLGVMSQFDSMHLKSTTDSYEASGNGWMAGPYATVRLTDHLFAQGRLEVGRSYNDVRPYMTYTDEFGSTRWLASGGLVGSWQFGAWTFRPRASLEAIWNFADTGLSSTSTLSGTPTGPDGLRSRAAVGINTQFVDGISFDLTGSYDGIGASNYRAVEGGARLTLPFN